MQVSKREMKIKHNISVLFSAMLSAALLVQSCNFLEVDEIGKSDIENYFSEVTALAPAVYGTYNQIYSFYDKYFIEYGEVAGDLVNLSGTASDWSKNFNFSTTSDDDASPVGYIWKNAYNIIANANHIIYYAPLLKGENPGSTGLIDHVTAQGYFVRALMHFNLCLVYGQTYTFTSDASHPGVAIISRVPSMDDVVKRVSVAKVYQQVISDLNAAIALFDSTTYSLGEDYFAGSDACKALLARVYLYMHDYTRAAEYSSELIAIYPLTPHDDYVNMFCHASSKAYPENILRLDGYALAGNLKSFYRYDAPEAFPSAKLTALYADGDVRKDLLSYTPTYGPDASKVYTNVNMKFYCTEDIVDKDKHYDPFIFRCSEMYLIHAEASCALGDLAAAEKDVKAIMARAYGKDASEISLSYSGAAELDKIIMNERIKELCFEGNRLYDITRRHESLVRDAATTSTLKSMDYPDYRFVLAVPRVEMEANPDMVQNEGYYYE